MKTAKLFKKALAVMLALMLAAVPFIHQNASAEGTAQADMSGATVISFSESGITVTPGKYSGYTVEGNEVKIEAAGTYVLRGESSDASVKVKKETTGVVLVLDGLELSSKSGAPIVCAKSTEVTIIAAAGTVNTLADTELNNDETHADNLDAENAVIKCKDGSNVVIAGEGTLNIIANGKNGIKGGASTELEGESSLTVRELTLNIKANVNDALKADTLLNVESGNITIEAADDAIKSDYTLNIGTEGGEGPNINVISSNEGIEAATLNVYSGNIIVNSTDDGINAANSDLTGYSFECNFYGGKIVINTTTGDGIDSNGSISFAGGELEVYSSTRSDNSPFDADGGISLSGGTVFGIGMPGMGSLPSSTEQSYVYFGSGGMGFGGRGGFNGMGGFGGQNGTGGFPGSDGSFGGFPGGNGMQPPTDANGNGMQPPTDANGNEIQPPTDANGNVMQPPTDAQSGAAERRSGRDGSQGGFGGGFPGGFGGEQSGSSVSISEGDEVSIVDASGNTVYSVTAKRSASFVFLSTESMSEGETYSLVVNGTEIASSQASAAASSTGGFGRGGRDAANGSASNESGSGSESGAQSGSEAQSESTESAENAENGSASAVSLVASSKSSGGSDGFERTIMLVLGAAALVAIACTATIITMNARNRKKLASAERDSGESR